MTFGLAGFGLAQGERVALTDGVVGEYTSDIERVLGYGYRNLLRCAPEVGVTDLACAAGEKALAAAGVAASSLQLVVLAITDIPEYLYWDAAASVANRLGAVSAEAVLLNQACAAGIAGFDTVAGRFATHPDYERALLISAHRTCEPYWNRVETQSMVFSDGAAAAVAARDAGQLRWQLNEQITDGRFADHFRLDVGGAAAPFTAGREPASARDVWDVMESFDYDPDRFTEYLDELNRRLADVVRRACRRHGSTPQQLDHVLLLHDTRRSMTVAAEAVGVDLARTNIELAMDNGHLGAADHLFDLATYAETNRLRAGDLVALAGVGRGMHWACALFEA
jgi:3-oxoacyl-[acyl-carrier-protein] synthase-3